ncbi:MAG: tRNA pseudouridine(38-40) synthase TruA [Planctomycetaceae bacterium]|nr:tRNA pseudouridine(38-40) synthase TruA [Planctomycetaceae bacterium]
MTDLQNIPEVRIRLDIAYRGTRYHGWQRQDSVPTIQGEIETALKRIVGSPIAIRGSSRTDTGVHAIQQTAVFDTISTIPPERFTPVLNANLPLDIRILRSFQVPPQFDPISNCLRKHYCYLIDDSPVLSPFLLNAVWHYRFGALDTELMHTAVQEFLGEHDFSSFQSVGSPRKSTVRTIFDISVKRRIISPPFGIPVIALDVEGNGFLYHQVRTMVGTLTAIGNGKQPTAWVTEVLAAKDRCVAGITAPPEGLYLAGITFDPVMFPPEHDMPSQGNCGRHDVTQGERDK